ncbi:MAG: hypothetical protein A3K03_02280 [Bdellovibrionales bacterium RIFOXYD1_FULL_44_7]|nr:MAG: hypothetical protein A3K03_02280 [Bdellovibrionales bacterium RIFOXYD1_FULL_44_7]
MMIRAKVLALLITLTVFNISTDVLAEPLNITPFIGTEHNYRCRSGTIDQNNVIGIMTYPVDLQTDVAYILFRKAGVKTDIEVKLMRQDAKMLAAEMRSLLSKERKRPIRIEAATNKEGQCQVIQITG